MNATHTNLCDQAEDIMRRFKFESVQRAMEALNWRWFDAGVPSIERLRGTADQLLTRRSRST